MIVRLCIQDILKVSKYASILYVCELSVPLLYF